MLIIDKDSVNDTRHKLGDAGKVGDVADDVRRMLDIKQALLWRSEAMSPCCGSLHEISSYLTFEVTTLENTLNALESDDIAQASFLLGEYERFLEEHNEPSQPYYCQS